LSRRCWRYCLSPGAQFHDRSGPVLCGCLDTEPAFTCQSNSTLYVTAGFLTLIAQQIGAPDTPYALASLLSHEIGHVVQALVHDQKSATADDATSQRIEQQADRLSGVWAHAMALDGKLDAARFNKVARDTRAAGGGDHHWHDRGRPQSCQLATFH